MSKRKLTKAKKATRKRKAKEEARRARRREQKLLQQAKRRAHEALDALWRSGETTRKEAYVWLAEQLCIPMSRCHIGMMTAKDCEVVVQLCKERQGDVT